MQNCRQKKKELGIPLSNPKPLTRDKAKEKREQDRIRQRKYRASLEDRPQKRGWITKRKKQKAAELLQLDSSTSSSSETQQLSTQDSALQLQRSSKEQSQKLLRKYANNPAMLAGVVSDVIEVASNIPAVQQALEDADILPAASRKASVAVHAEVQQQVDELRKNKTSPSNQQRATLSNILLKAHSGNKNAIRKSYGISYSFLQKCSDGNLERKQRKDALSQEEKQEVVNFYKRGDVSKCNPSPAAVSKKTNLPKRYMEKTIREAHKEFMSENDVQISFSHFAKLRPRDTCVCKYTKYISSCCEYCLNIVLKRDALNAFLNGKNFRDILVPGKYDLSSLTLCGKAAKGQHLRLCLDRKCSDCGIINIRRQLQPALDQHADAMVHWKRWSLDQQETQDRTGAVKMTSRRVLLQKEGCLDELLSELEEGMASFSLHLANKDWQHQMYSALARNLPQEWLLFCMDFAENFGCFYQNEAQGAHWTREQVTIHPIVATYHCPVDGETITDSLIFISADLKHDSHAVHHFVQLAMQELHSRGLHFSKAVHFSDGCASQYKGKTSFVDCTHGTIDYGVPTEKHFFGSPHGKGPCDAEIGVIKRMTASAVKAQRAQVSTALEMFEYCRDNLSRPKNDAEHAHSLRSFLFVPQGAVNRARPDRTGNEIKPVVGTRTLHCTREMMPFVLSARERSCFCLACIEGEGQCANADFCGEWRVAHLKKRTRGENFFFFNLMNFILHCFC